METDCTPYDIYGNTCYGTEWKGYFELNIDLLAESDNGLGHDVYLSKSDLPPYIKEAYPDFWTRVTFHRKPTLFVS